MKDPKASTYRDAGVDIDAGNRLVDRIKPFVRATNRPGVIGDIGGFGGLFALDTGRYREPVLVSGADGVGTKLALAIELGVHDTVGIDLVAMCANDVVVQGAEPLFFLDYYACGHLDEDVAATVIEGIAEGCRQAGAALIGGETAEMPGMYAEGDYDLAGFCVGVAERERIIDGSRVSAGDSVIGLASSGPHSNGYSLIRKVLRDSDARADSPWEDTTLGRHLLTPTRIYVPAVLALAAACDLRAVAHITGGGLPENLARVLPGTVDAILAEDSWERPAIFGWLQERGKIPEEEMYRTFNCGVGMAVIVPSSQSDDAISVLHSHGENAWLLGTIVPGKGELSFES